VPRAPGSREPRRTRHPPDHHHHHSIAPRPPMPSQTRDRPTAAFLLNQPGPVPAASARTPKRNRVPETGTRLYIATLVQREERERERAPSLLFSPPNLRPTTAQRRGAANRNNQAPGGGGGNFRTRSPRRDKNQARAAVEDQSGGAAGSSSPPIPLLGVRRGEE
jgi:hypothetical protein